MAGEFALFPGYQGNATRLIGKEMDAALPLLCIFNPPSGPGNINLIIMSKGFADYLCVMAREIDRDFARDAEGIEMPMFREEYEEWLSERIKTKDNYMRWLQKADEWFCESDLDSDFWTRLAKSWQESDFQKVLELCDSYEKDLVDAQREAAGDNEYGETPKEIGNWVSAFRKYVEFLKECIEKASDESKDKAQMIADARRTAGHFPLEGQFIDWCVENGQPKKSASSYASNLRRLNREILCKSGHDFFHEKLKPLIEVRNANKIDAMLTIIDSIVTTQRLYTYNETEMPHDALSNALSALRKYADFLKEVLANPNLEPKKSTSYKYIPLNVEFFDWMNDEGGLKVSVARSYMSFLRTLFRYILEKTGGKLLLGQWLESRLEKGDITGAIKDIESVDSRVITPRIYARQTEPLSCKQAIDCRSALRKYKAFLQSLALDNDVEETENREPADEVLVAEPTYVDNDAIIEMVDKDGLLDNFSQRILTQDRIGMNEGKRTFFPISVINKIFTRSQKLSKKRGQNNNNKSWLDKWTSDTVLDIRVITDRGTFTVKEIDGIIIGQKGVVVEVNGTKAKLLSPVVDPTAKPVEMTSKRLCDIHIDHEPLMSKILIDNAYKLPGLAALTDIIIKYAAANGIGDNQGNIREISSGLLPRETKMRPEDEKRFSEMEELIPALKQDLEFIRKAATLSLMDAKYNLRKK